ncbi:MAG: YlxR family protein [Syntrophomonas sp.]|nr:YlxR family protein [Syntrophomonas sp.]
MPKVRKVPQRMCVGCRVMKNKKELMRIVRTPEGSIEVDETGKKSGRGAYICRDANCLAIAIKGKRLQKALDHEIGLEVLEKIKEKLQSSS